MSQFTILDNDSYTAKTQLTYDFSIDQQIAGYCEAFDIEGDVQFSYTKFRTYIHNAIVGTLAKAGAGALDIVVDDTYNLQLLVELCCSELDEAIVELNKIDALDLINEATIAGVSV